MSESKWDDEKRQWWKEQLKFWLYVRKYGAALVGGELHRDYLIKLGFPRERIFLGYDAVDNDYFDQQAEIARQDPLAARHRQPRIPSRPYLIAVTRFIKRKNVSRLVEAFAAYRQEVGDDQAWDLVICGSGEEEASIRNLILAKGLNDCVHLPGFITYQAIGDWYGLANAFVHPALQEQWGLVVNEACAAGLPILCSRTVGACHELVHEGDNGLLFNPESTQDMTRALLSIHQLDSDARTKMAQSSRMIVADYGSQNFAEGLINAANITIMQNRKTLKVS
jgi:glycosyltransferase involved in cell wall biosynthesis